MVTIGECLSGGDSSLEGVARALFRAAEGRGAGDRPAPA